MAETNVVTWRIGDHEYAVDLYDIDGLEWRDAKRATGMGQIELQTAALAQKDFEAIAALIWIWRRRDEAVTYEDVLGSMKYSTTLREPVTRKAAQRNGRVRAASSSS